eukprot:Gb_10645 [translate_table: standard]
MLLTPNGRFETQTKICLSISNHHPEHWQPSWSVRTALVALIAFMPTKPNGALGSLDYTKEERHTLAIKSRTVTPKSDNVGRQKLIDEIHEYMLMKAPPVPELRTEAPSVTDNSGPEAPTDNSDAAEQSSTYEGENHHASQVETAEQPQGEEPEILEANELHLNTNVSSVTVGSSADLRLSTRASAVDARAEERVADVHKTTTVVSQKKPVDDRGLTWLALGLSVAIIALLVKKFLKSSWWMDA